LKCVYVDIWRPAQVQSAEDTNYFLAIINGFSSYKTVFFLNSKSADITLKLFKTYQIETEQQTRKVLKQVCLDMGREWFNDL